MRTKTLLGLISALLITHSISATSARTIYPQLVGVRTVALNFSPQTVPGLDTDALEQEIRQRLEAANLIIDSTAPTVLFVQITYQRVPECADSLVIQTHIALSEDAVIKRGNRSETVYVDTWRETEEFVEPAGKAAEVAHTSTVGLVKYFIEATDYAASVVETKR
jgi:hypothetical protein